MTVRDGGRVEAQNVYVNEDGVLTGNGGTIAANVIVDGGSVAPGDSPGSMTIDGDLTVNRGMLDFEIAGLMTDQFDQLFVAGDAIFADGAEISVSFIDGFGPEIGDMFELLRVEGLNTLPLAMVDFTVNGLRAGLGFDFVVNGDGSLIGSVIARTSEVPVPAGVWLMGTALAGLRLAKRKKKAA